METQTRKLYRSRKDRIVGGVSAGLGEYFNIDPVLVRAIFVLLTLINGFGLLFYIILMLIIPEEPTEEKAETKIESQVQEAAQELKSKAESMVSELKDGFKNNRRCDKRNIIGIIVVILGFYLLLNEIFPINILRWDLLWPIIIILIGFHLIFKRKGK